jgi:hypothetical protein
MGYILMAALLGLLVLVISQLVVYIASRHRDNQLGLQGDGTELKHQFATPSTTKLQTEERITKRGRLWDVLMGLTLILVSIPVAILATIVAVPFWWLLERMTGWNIVGHSGPDEWCYALVYALVLAYFVRLRSRQNPRPDLT